VTYVGNLQSIKASSGADIVTKEVLKGEDLSLNVSSDLYALLEAQNN